MSKTLPKDILNVLDTHLSQLPFDISADSLRGSYLTFIKATIVEQGAKWLESNLGGVDTQDEL